MNSWNRWKVGWVFWEGWVGRYVERRNGEYMLTDGKRKNILPMLT